MNVSFPHHEAERWLEAEWPTTIVRDRYGGVYSGAEWLAFPLLPNEVPGAIVADDVSCRSFWLQRKTPGSTPIGLGTTPEKALEQLRAFMAEQVNVLKT